MNASRKTPRKSERNKLPVFENELPAKVECRPNIAGETNNGRHQAGGDGRGRFVSMGLSTFGTTWRSVERLLCDRDGRIG